VSTLSPTQVYKLARDAGLAPPTAVVATAIAGAESGYRTDAMGDTTLENATWGPSVGLWQIRSEKAQYGTGQARDASKLTDPAFNARSMAQISGAGKNFGPWTTYRNGAFQKYMGSSASAANNDYGPLGGLAGGLAGGLIGGVGEAAGAAAGALNPFADWQSSALKIGAGLMAAVLIVLGAVHTVSN
jgi:hypothetical protein